MEKNNKIMRIKNRNFSSTPFHLSTPPPHREPFYYRNMPLEMKAIIPTLTLEQMFELLVCGDNLDDDIDVDLPSAVDGGVVHVKPGRTTFTTSIQ